jgi:predicted ester cyclase
MSEENKTIVLKYFEEQDSQNFDKAIELLATNFAAHVLRVRDPVDRLGYKQSLLTFYSAFPDGHHTFEDVIAEGDKVVTRGTFRGTHEGQFRGIPPTGKRVAFPVMHIDRLENGKIVEHWGHGDTLGVLQQLGVVPTPFLAT